MERKRNSDICLDYLISLNKKIEILGKLNLNDLSLHSENFFLIFFNLLFGLNLENANNLTANAEAIDLIDTKNKKIIQISATCTKQKVENTLNKSVLKEFSEQNYLIQFVFIGHQNNRIKSYSFSNPYNVKFNRKEDIFLTEDILRKFNTLTIEDQRSILNFLELELSQVYSLNENDLKREICSEISQILKKNYLIWSNFGPNSETAIKNPLSTTVSSIWNTRKKEIFDNNSKILDLFHKHQLLFTLEEKNVFIDFEEHSLIFELNHTTRLDKTAYKTFPQQFADLIDDIINERR